MPFAFGKRRITVKSNNNTLNKYKHNVYYQYLFHFTRNLDLTQGIWMLYLASRGLSLLQLGALEGIFHLVSFLMETPTGVIADLFGRKISRILGRLMEVVSIILMLQGQQFEHYVLSFIVLAIAYNLESGAGEALLYDSLKAVGNEKSFIKINGQLEALYQVAKVVALVVGGYLGKIHYRWVYIVALFISLLALFQCFLFTEVKLKPNKKRHIGLLGAIGEQYKACGSVIRSSKQLTYLLLYNSMTGAFITISFYYLQAMWKGQGSGEVLIGIMLAIGSGGAALGGLFASYIEKELGEKVLLKLLPVCIVIGLWGICIPKITYVAFALISCVESMGYVIISNYIHKMLHSELRATIISFESTLFSLIMIGVFPLFGIIADHMNIQVAFMLLATMATVMSLINLVVLNKKNQGIEASKLDLNA